MTAAAITINGGVGGVSNTFLPLNTLVSLANANNTGVVSWAWTLVDRPLGSTAALSATNVAAPTFTPDCEGSYLLRLVVNTGLLDETRNQVVGAVRQRRTFTRIPAFTETTEVTPKGWANAANDMLQRLDQQVADPNLLVAVCVEVGGLTAGQVAYISDANIINAGLPGAAQLLGAALASAATYTQGALGTLYCVEGAPDGSLSVLLGELVVLRRVGYVRLTLAAVYGELATLTDLGGIDVTYAGATVQRSVGVVVWVGGGDCVVHFNGNHPNGSLLISDLVIGPTGDIFFAGGGGHTIATEGADDLEIQPGGSLFFGNSSGSNFWEIEPVNGTLQAVAINRQISGVADPVAGQDATPAIWVQRNFAPMMLAWGNTNSGNVPSTTTYIDFGAAWRAATVVYASALPLPAPMSLKNMRIMAAVTSVHDDTVVFKIQYFNPAGPGAPVVLSPTVSLVPGAWYAEDLVNVTPVIPAGMILQVTALSGAAQTKGVSNFIVSFMGTTET